MKKLVWLSLLVLGVAIAGGAQTAQAVTQASGQIQGTVVADKSVGQIKGATVAAYRLNPAPAVGGQATVDKSGHFTIGSLPPGKYGVCAIESSGQQLNGCEWRDTEVTVDVTNGAIAGPITITIKAPSVLTVRLNDTANSLKKQISDAAPPHVLVGVWDAKGNFHPALETNKDASGITYQVKIPFDTALRLHVQSQLVTLETSAHESVSIPGHSQSVIHSSGKSPDQQPSFSFNAIGRN